MNVVTLVTQKGGSGKSTLTVGLAVAAMEDANRVAVIEADAQGTVSSWRRRRTNPYPHVDRVADRVEIERAIPRLRAEVLHAQFQRDRQPDQRADRGWCAVGASLIPCLANLLRSRQRGLRPPSQRQQGPR